jgi:hypothetical protein
MAGMTSSCERPHWRGGAKVYDNGERVEPSLHVLEGRLVDHDELDDRTLRLEPDLPRRDGFLSIRYWGHDPDVLLAATGARYQSELRNPTRWTGAGEPPGIWQPPDPARVERGAATRPG